MRGWVPVFLELFPSFRASVASTRVGRFLEVGFRFLGRSSGGSGSERLRAGKPMNPEGLNRSVGGERAGGLGVFGSPRFRVLGVLAFVCALFVVVLLYYAGLFRAGFPGELFCYCNPYHKSLRIA